MNYLAFDLGASGGKLFLAKTADKKVSIEEVHRFSLRPTIMSGCMFWDIFQIYNEMVIGIKKAVEITDDNIDSFGIDSFSNDFGLVDKNGHLLSPVRSYRDPRTARWSKEIYEKMSPEELYHASGNQNALFNTLMQLAAMRLDGHGFLLDNAYKLLFIPDLLISFLTGEFACEYTLASVSQLFDYEKNDWSEKILKAYDIPKSIFAPIKQPGQILAKTSDEFNKSIGSKGFNVSTVCEHDTASAYLSSPVKEDAVLISCGTWALIGCESETPIINDYTYNANIANEGSIPGHHRLLKNTMSSWFIQGTLDYYKERGQEFSYEQLDELAKTATPNQHCFDPDYDTFYEPGNIPEKIKDYCLMKTGKAPEDIGALVRCIYESLALKFKNVIEQLETTTGKTYDVINMFGGGSQAEMLCSFVANTTGKKVVAGPVEATAIGNISLQMIAMKECKDVDETKALMQTSYEPKIFEPIIDR